MIPSSSHTYTAKINLCRFIDVSAQILINHLLIQMSIDPVPYVIPIHDCKQIVWYPIEYRSINYRFNYQLI